MLRAIRTCGQFMMQKERICREDYGMSVNLLACGNGQERTTSPRCKTEMTRTTLRALFSEKDGDDDDERNMREERDHRHDTTPKSPRSCICKRSECNSVSKRSNTYRVQPVDRPR